MLDLISALSLVSVGESSLPEVSQLGSAAGLGSVWAVLEYSLRPRTVGFTLSLSFRPWPSGKAGAIGYWGRNRLQVFLLTW